MILVQFCFVPVVAAHKSIQGCAVSGVQFEFVGFKGFLNNLSVDMTLAPTFGIFRVRSFPVQPQNTESAAQDLLAMQGFDIAMLDLEDMSYNEINRLAGSLPPILLRQWLCVLTHDQGA